MTLLALLQAALKKPLTTEDGEATPLELLPGLTESEIVKLEGSLPCRIPTDVRELLAYCRGFQGGAIDFVDFTGEGGGFAFEPIFPHGHSIAGDGVGNFWVVDLFPESTQWGPIYYACHDAPVIFYQSPSLEHFLTELFKMGEPPFKSLVADVMEHSLFDVWRKNPGVLSYEQAADSDDPEMRAFAETLNPSFQVVDLRNAPIGMGFSWGRYGSNTEVRRHSPLPIFAYEKPKGLLSRLFGKR